MAGFGQSTQSILADSHPRDMIEDGGSATVSNPLRSFMSTQPTCSVMMATYRPKAFLSSQISSVVSQEGVSVKLLISDDSENKEVLKSLLDVSCVQGSTLIPGQVDIIDGPQAGLASLNFFNLVLNNSCEAEFYAFADQDDIWRADKLAQAIELLTMTGADCYSSELNIWTPPRSFLSSVISHRWRIKKGLFGLFFAEGAGCTYVISRTAFLSLQQRLHEIVSKDLLCLLFSHDLFTSAFLHSQGFKWYHDNRSMIYYRQHQSNVWSAHVISFDGLRKRLNLLRRQHYYALLYLAWMGSPLGSIASQSWRSLCRLSIRDRVFLLYTAFNAINIFTLKTVGLVFFILFTRKQQLMPCNLD